MSEHASLDPRRTVECVPSSQTPATVADTGDCGAGDSTGPYLPPPPADAPSIPGFRVTGEIARGGMGRVYAAHDLTLDREVAIKTLLPGAKAERFVTEAKVTARLPHPGIPPVHALGTLADGTPYLAMKLIRGRTLAELLNERPSPLAELPRFVQIFEQIAQAVGFAHAQGILHRDLKPLNVMVGAFGEVQVMDWGLAKELQIADCRLKIEDGSANRQSAIGHRQSEETQAGTVLGTPGYMAPEQARGEAVDARADVFALGATLAVILTGQPAFVGASAREVIGKTARADLADVRRRLTGSGADGELIALALSCLSAEVSERPADGHAVASLVAAYRAGVEARLKRAETERAEAQVREAEQRKRRRTVLWAGGLVAVALLAGLGVSLWQMFRAIAAEGQANQNLLAEQQARADEEKARQQAFAALRSMTDDVVEKKFAQGTVLAEEDRAFLRGVIAQYDAFAAIKSDDAQSRGLRAGARLRVGAMHSRLGGFQEAGQDLDQAVGLWQQLTTDFPSRPDFRQELTKSYNERALLFRQTGRLQEAEQDYAQALRIQKQLVAEFPNRADCRQELAGVHNNRGNLRKATGRLREAEQDFDQALNLFQQLTAEFPSRPEFRRWLAGGFDNRGALLYETGRPREAEQDFNRALGIHRQLAAEFSYRPDFRQELALSHYNRGTVLRNAGRLQSAEQDFDQALSLYKQLAAEFPARPEFRYELAASLINRGNLLRATGRPREAEKDYEQALNLQKELATDFPSRPEFRQDLAATYSNRGGLLSHTGRLKEAEQDYDQALSLQKQLVAEFPNRPEFRQELANSHNNRGLLLRDTGRLHAAEEAFDQALSINRQLAAEFPNRFEFRQELANSHNNRGTLLSSAGRLKEAEKDFGQTLVIQKQLAADLPTQPEVRNDLAGTCVNLASLQLQQRNAAAAKRTLLEGRPHHLAALKANPRSPTYRQYYRNYLNVLTAVHAALLEPEDALQTALTCRDLGWNAPADAYDAACFLSRCIPIVASHDKLDDAKRKEAAQVYGDAAMRLLRDAVSKGWKDLGHMQQDTDLDPLRQREDFQKLIARLGTPNRAKPAREEVGAK